MDPGVSVRKQKLHRKPREACKNSWSPRGSLKSFTLTILWNSAKACEDLSWNHCTSPPHRSETNGIVERAVRRVKQGTSAVLLQSGLNESWWADSMECLTYLRNVTDLLSDGKTPYERRFGQPFKGPIRHNAKEVTISQRRRIHFSSRRWTNQTPWRRSRPENIHLDTAATNSRRE